MIRIQKASINLIRDDKEEIEDQLSEEIKGKFGKDIFEGKQIKHTETIYFLPSRHNNKTKNQLLKTRTRE